MSPPLPSRSQTHRLLILSAGSLLGQNILDALEPRRRQIEVIGADAQADNGRLFRYDHVYLVPLIDEETAFEKRLLEVIGLEEPDLIIPGRDHDVLFLSQFSSRHPQWSSRIPCGTYEAARIMQDKALSFEFAQKCDLPFAETLLVTHTITLADLLQWVRRTGFPVVAKPREGYGSQGVRILFTEDHLRSVLSAPGYVLQEYLGTPPDWEKLKRTFDQGVPLFFSIPEEAQYAGQTIISPTGELSDIFCSINRMVMGRCEASQKIDEPELLESTRAAAQALASIGWRGSFNIQLKRTPGGQFKINEMNGRMSGSTSARRLMGFDEIRLLYKAFTGQDPGLAASADNGDATSVTRTLTDCFAPAKYVATLRRDGVWRRT
jgi:carbamoylphosphate synthase large subunit